MANSKPMTKRATKTDGTQDMKVVPTILYSNGSIGYNLNHADTRNKSPHKKLPRNTSLFFKLNQKKKTPDRNQALLIKY